MMSLTLSKTATTLIQVVMCSMYLWNWSWSTKVVTPFAMFECRQSPMASNWSRSLRAIIKMVRDVFLVCIQINRCHQFCLPPHSFKISQQTQKRCEAGRWDADIKMSRSACQHVDGCAVLVLKPVAAEMMRVQPMMVVEARKRMCPFLGVCLIAGWYDRRVAFVSWLQSRAFWKSEHGGEPLFFVLLLLAWQIQKKTAYVN